MTKTDAPHLPTLYHQGKAGAIYSWCIWTEGPDIVTEYGQVDGEKQIARKTATPKNVGRSNETTAEAQATLEAAAMHTKKLDTKYALSVEEAQAERIRPMLADDFEKRKTRNVTYPAFAQAKLDGVRALAYWEGDRIEIVSRGGKSWREKGSIEHIATALEQLLPKGMLWDSELYSHGDTFQQATRLVNKYRAGLSETLVMHVYDVINGDNLSQPFTERLLALEALGRVLPAGGPVETVPTITVQSDEEVYAAQMRFVEEGFEGAMVRLPTGEYQYGKRSFDLLKVKSFLDAEYPIVGHKTGVGRFDGAVIWVCEMANGKTFDVVPRGTMEERRQWHDTADEYYGQMLNVRYFETTEDGVPRFPVGAGIRAPEDIS